MTNSARVVASTVDRASGPLDRIARRWENLQKQGAKGLAIGAGVALTNRALGFLEGALDRVTDFLASSAKAASDLREQMSKSQVVFGDASQKMDKFGDRAAIALGLSKRAALEAAGGFGVFFRGAGEAQASAERMSERVVALASDLASFNNLDPTDVLEKLRSGLAGEAEPLRSVGVFLTEAKVKAKAMELGLADAHGQLSEGAKILARYQIILEETALAQGDFARTANSTANQQRQINSSFENAQARFGANVEKIWNGIQTVILAALDEQYRAERTRQSRVDAIRQMDLATLKRVLARGNNEREYAAMISLEIARREHQGTTAEGLAALRELGAARNKAAIEAMAASKQTSSYIIKTFSDARPRAKHMVEKTLAELAGAVRDRRAGWRQLWQDYADAMEDRLAPAAELREVKRRLDKAIKDFPSILRSGDAGLIATAAATIKGLQTEYDKLSGATSSVGTRAMQQLAAAMKNSKDPKDAAIYQKIAVDTALGLLPSSAYGFGYATAEQLAAGIKAGRKLVQDAADTIARDVDDRVHVASPAKKGPWSKDGGPEGWGQRFSELLAKGMAAAMPKDIGVPAWAGASAGGGYGGGLGGGGEIVVPVYLNGREIARAVAADQSFRRPRTTFVKS